MNREIKFRAWNGEKMSETFDLGDVSYEGFPDICLDDTGEEIMPNVIFMQYTGLKDNNGKEIYRGDLIKGHIGIAEVVYSVYLGIAPGFTLVYKDLNNEVDIYDCEIVGNIYENPELIT